jgi:Concanavalin A-like lectin/glucanases superfamily
MRKQLLTYYFILLWCCFVNHLNAQVNRNFHNNNYTPIDQSIFNVIVSGSILHLDAAKTNSYSGSGTAWKDISGNANNVTLPSVLANTFANTNGGSFLFSQSSTNTITKSPLSNFTFTPSSGITVEVWYKRVVTNDFQFWVSDNAANYRFGTTSTGTFFWNMGTRNDRSPGGYALPDVVWKHIVFTGATEGSTIMTRVYVDGVQQLTQNEGYNTIAAFNNLLIGSGEGVGLYLLKGNLAVCRIYKKALTSNEIVQNFNVDKARFGL